MKLVIATSLAALALGALGTAYAQAVTEVVVTGRKAPGTEMQSKTVSFSDLDLNKVSGLTTLNNRIRSAATDVCSPQPQTQDIAGNTDYKKCVAHAVNMAVASVNNPGLTSMVASSAR